MTTFLLVGFVIALFAAVILVCRLPDEAGDLQRIQDIRDRQATREAGEQA